MRAKLKKIIQQDKIIELSAACPADSSVHKSIGPFLFSAGPFHVHFCISSRIIRIFSRKPHVIRFCINAKKISHPFRTFPYRSPAAVVTVRKKAFVRERTCRRTKDPCCAEHVPHRPGPTDSWPCPHSRKNGREKCGRAAHEAEFPAAQTKKSGPSPRVALSLFKKQVLGLKKTDGPLSLPLRRISAWNRPPEPCPAWRCDPAGGRR